MVFFNLNKLDLKDKVLVKHNFYKMVNCPETNYWDMMDNETKLNNKQKLQWYWNFWFVALLKQA